MCVCVCVVEVDLALYALLARSLLDWRYTRLWRRRDEVKRLVKIHGRRNQGSFKRVVPEGSNARNKTGGCSRAGLKH